LDRKNDLIFYLVQHIVVLVKPEDRNREILPALIYNYICFWDKSKDNSEPPWSSPKPSKGIKGISMRKYPLLEKDSRADLVGVRKKMTHYFLC
jgi:hypothetical protein